MCSYCVHVQSMYYLIKYISTKTSTILSEIIVDLKVFFDSCHCQVPKIPLLEEPLQLFVFNVELVN